MSREAKGKEPMEEVKGKEAEEGDVGNVNDPGAGTSDLIPIRDAELKNKSQRAFSRAKSALTMSYKWERILLAAIREAIIAFRDKVESRVQYLRMKVVSYEIEVQLTHPHAIRYVPARVRQQRLIEFDLEYQKIKDMCDEDARSVMVGFELAIDEHGKHEVPPPSEDISEAVARRVVPAVPSPPFEGALAKAWVQRLSSSVDLAETILIGIREIKMSAAASIKELRKDLISGR